MITLKAIITSLACVSLVLIAGPDDPPWTSTYRISPGDTASLTAADVVGPDGLVYPDFTYAGIPGGIPLLEDATIYAAADFGAIPDDGQDDYPALQSAITSIGSQGGGILQLETGTYIINGLLFVGFDNVVIRGGGRTQTTLDFTYDLPQKTGCIYGIADNDTIQDEGTYLFLAHPGDLDRIEVHYNNLKTAEYLIQTSDETGRMWAFSFSGKTIRGTTSKSPTQLHTLTLKAYYQDGSVSTDSVAVYWGYSASALPFKERRYLHSSGYIGEIGMLNIFGDHTSQYTWDLAVDAERGDTTITLASIPTNLQTGDLIELTQDTTQAWADMTAAISTSVATRRQYLLVTAINGTTLTLNQPIRETKVAAEGGRIRTIYPIRRCGIEDLAIQHTSPRLVTSIYFQRAQECWVKGVSVTKSGRNPYMMSSGKFCELRDFEAHQSWDNLGSSAYIVWTNSHDCLGDGITSSGLRHAPNLQYSSTGCVVRNSYCQDSDLQWHGGWAYENLVETTTIQTSFGTGAYGPSVWVERTDSHHGPSGGPRNIIYHCDLTSPVIPSSHWARPAGIFLGGANEAWMILHNRISTPEGPGIHLRRRTFDHTIRNNVFVLAEASQALAEYETDYAENCVDIAYYSNQIFGNQASLVSGDVRPYLTDTAQPNIIAAANANAPAPIAPIPSIFAWQRRHGMSTTTQVIEAESAVTGQHFSPFVTMTDPQCYAGTCITRPGNDDSNAWSPPTAGVAEYTFEIFDNQTTAFWMRVYGATSSDDSYWVGIDDEPMTAWHFGADPDWVWKKWSDKSLTTGTHRLRIAYREDGACLDRIILTADLTMVPDDITIDFAAADALGQQDAYPFEAARDGNATWITIPEGYGNSWSPATNGRLTFDFYCPESATYAIWALVRTPDASSDSCYFGIDTTALTSSDAWHFGTFTDWTWIKYGERTLSQGNHDLTLGRREDGAEVQRLLLTRDLQYVP